MTKRNIFIITLVLILLGISVFFHYYWIAMEWKDIIMTDAIIIGPIMAVFITRMHDEETFKKERKLIIFRALMKDRRNQLSNDFVSALNLIQVEFHEDTNVINVWKNLFESLTSSRPPKEDNDGGQRKFTDWNKKTTLLLHADEKSNF